jgi:hypothetical protein
LETRTAEMRDLTGGARIQAMLHRR